MNYTQLNYFALTSLSVASVISLFLPNVPKSIYFHRKDEKSGSGFSKASMVLIEHLKVAYSNPYVVKWSTWVALATCGYFQVGNYIQALWIHIQMEQNPENYNGAVEATATLLGTIQSFHSYN